ncbi:MAG: 16S rRNA (cytidine(1402)-2'-O)-methyltransferase [Candidatus Nealsonbacteria bacterium]
MSILYIVATPIGNLEDITKRALRVLSEVDLILCEDTRKTKILLDRFQIKTSVLSYHQHSKIEKINYIADFLRQGKNIALVSDAGTPGISDPGNKLIEQLLGFAVKGLKIVPIPGPSAVTTALSVCGFPTDRFLFLGFAPTKNKRQKFLKEVAASKCPVLFYESCYRILKTLGELDSLYAKYQLFDAKIVVGRELTKKFETIYRGNIKDVIMKIKEDEQKGEFVVIIDNKNHG